MLKKINRLTKDKEFESVFKKGKSSSDDLFIIKALANNLLNSHYGIIVSLKVHKKAIERNKIKRRVREALKDLDKKMLASYDIVIVSRPSVVHVSFKEIIASLYFIFCRLKLINEN